MASAGSILGWLLRLARRALVAGFVVLLLLTPVAGLTSDPMTCLGLFGGLWIVPCEGLLAVAAGALMAGAVGLASVLERQGLSGTTRVALALLAGSTMYVLQVPGLVLESDPPTCVSWLGRWDVPCGGWPALVMAAVTAAVVWVVLSVERVGASPQSGSKMTDEPDPLHTG